MNKFCKVISDMKIKQNITLGIRRSQQGASLMIVLILLTIVSMLGVAGIQISMMSERGARNDRDQLLAWQSAEAGLADAELDLFTPALPAVSASTRGTIFSPSTNVLSFVDGCGSSGNSSGLCTLVATGKPAWLTVDFDAPASSSQTAEYGQFTGRAFAAGLAGVQPARKPRYVIELIPDQFGAGSESRDRGSSEPKFVYRVTSMGYGPRPDIQAVVQMLYRD